MSAVMNLRTTFVLGGVLVVSSACGGRGEAVHIARGNTYFDNGQYAEAIIEYRTVLQKNPQAGEVRFKLAEAYFKLSDLPNALREYVRAADLLPGSLDAQVKAGNSLLLSRSFDDAAARADRALAIDSTHVEALVLRGSALAGLRDSSAAIAEYEEAIALDPDNSSAYRNLGAMQLSQGKKDHAEQTFRKAVEMAPGSVAPRLALANFLWSVGQYDEAEKALKAALAIDLSHVGANRAIGVFYLAASRPAEARKYLESTAHVSDTTDAWLGLADYFTVAKQPQEARKALDRIKNRDDAFVAANVRLAAFDAADGNRAIARDRLHRVLERHPTEASALLLNARLLVVEKRPAEAIAAIGTILQKHAGSGAAVQAHILAGQIHAASDRLQDAIRAFEEAIKIDSRQLGATLSLAALYQAVGDTPRSANLAQQALAIAPGHPEAESLLLRTQLRGPEPALGKPALDTLAKKYPDSVTVKQLTAEYQLSRREVGPARESYAKALQANPGDMQSLTALVEIDLATGDTTRALERIQERLASPNPSVDTLLLGARVYARTNDAAQAEALLHRAIAADPSRVAGYNLLAQLYVRGNRIDEAQRQYQAVIDRNPASAAAVAMLGILSERQGQLDQAEKHYQRALELDPRSIVAANNLAWLFVSGNRHLDQALQLAQTAAAQAPDHPKVNDTLGWIYYRKGMGSRAVQHLEASVRRAPKEPTFYYHLGMAYADLGETAKARRALEQAIQLDANFGDVAEARKALESLGPPR